MLWLLALGGLLLGPPEESTPLRVGMDTRSPPGAFVPGLDFSGEDLLQPPAISKAQLGRLTGFEVDR